LLLIDNQTINQHKDHLRIQIQLENLNAVKDIIKSNEFSNEEKIHLIQSQFILETAEMKQLDQEIKDLTTIEAFFADHLEHPESLCGMCDDRCELDAPEGQMTIFDFMTFEPVPEQASASMTKVKNSTPPAPEAPEIPSELSKELAAAIGTMQELASTVLAAFEK